MISHVDPVFNSIELSNLSLNYDPQVTHNDPQNFAIGARQIVFRTVSSDFLSTLLAQTFLLGNDLELFFDSCSLPASYGEQHRMLTRPTSLIFYNIPFDVQQDDGSLFRAITDLQPIGVTFIDCAGVNDAFFSLLTGDGNCAPSQYIQSLNITDCRGFTVQAIRTYVSARAKLQPDPPEIWLGVVSLESVEVSRGPSLSADDTAWFDDLNNTGACVVQWNVDNNE